MKILWIIFCFFSFQLYAEAPLVSKNYLIGFQELNNEAQWMDKPIQIKGFLYNDRKQWLLSPEPQLKSCCIGTQGKAHQQIYLDVNFNEDWKNQLVEVSGILQKNSLGHFVLRKTSFIEQKNQEGWIILVAFFVIAVIGVLLSKIACKSRF